MIYSNIDLGSLISKKEIISFDNTKISYLFSKPNEKERKEIGWEKREKQKKRKRGKRKKKKYLVFIHGLTGSYNSWDQIIPKMVDEGFGIIAPDLRGHFSSERFPKDYSYVACAKDINEIIKKEKIEQIVFVTHCYGSLVALEFYKMFSKKVKAFIFCSADYAHVLKSMYNINTHFLRKPTLFLLDLLKGIFKREIKYNPYKMSKILKKCYEFRNHWLTIVRMFPYAVNYNGTEVLSKIKVSTIIIAGRFDWLVSKKRSIKMNKYIKGSKLKIVKNAEHFIIKLNSKQVNKIMSDFLEEIK